MVNAGCSRIAISCESLLCPTGRQQSTSGFACAGTIASLGKAIASQVGKFDPRSLTDALWGFAKLGVRLDGGTVSKLAHRVKELASKFKPQEAANALWALIKLDQANGGNVMKVR